MSVNSQPGQSLSPIKRALQAIDDLQAKVDALEYAQQEPIAIIGMGCRFPGGGDNPEAFWQLLRDGVDTITEVPSDRWDIEKYYDPNPDIAGKMYTYSGGFLQHVDQFDPQFFGISPREAVSLDPQQRLLLEVSWEALENAGIAANQIVGSQTGIFIGIGQNDYANLLQNSGGPTQITTYTGTGNGFCFASGRLSYTLGLLGPNLAIDTACSSSLVAVHLACQSLRAGESDLALAGGVQLILSPEVTLFLCRAHALSPDGRCKTFDANANGYGRGEGCGVLVLKRLSDAVANKDNILALIRGSAVNHDGPSSGLTVPRGAAQQALIRQALEKSREDPSQISYVETHGTGTSLGDPIEVRALGAVLGEGRSPEEPLFIGSVKTNIGHLEAAAGVASLIKVILALQHREIPPHLHFHEPNPHINWDELPITVPTKPIPWVTKAQQRLAGVSSFGISGTNAHAVVQEAPERKLVSVTTEQRPLHLFTLSAKTEPALQQLVHRYEKYLATHPDLTIGDVCFTTNRGRSHFSHRLSIVTASMTELVDKLATCSSGQPAREVHIGQVKETILPEVAFLFTGENCQYLGLGQQLYNTQPTFRAALERCEQILQLYLDQPLLEILFQPSANSPLCYETPYKEAAVFALEYALFQLWQSWGVEPTIVLGYGVGEYAAACVAGVFNLEDGIKLVVEYARFKQASPQNSTALARFTKCTRTITYSSPKMNFVSPATGKLVNREISNSEYWNRYVGKSSLHLTTALTTLTQQDCQLFVECGPQLVLSHISKLKETGTYLSSLCSTQSDWQQILYSLSTLYIHGVSINWIGFHQYDPYYSCQLPTYPFQKQRYWIEVNDKEKQQFIKTSVVEFLNQGDSQKLIHLLSKGGKFSQEKLQLLPELVEELIRQHQQQFTTASVQDWLYRIKWEPKQSQPENSSETVHHLEPQSWLIFADTYGIAQSLAKLLQSQGQAYFLVYPGEEYKKETNIWYINPSEPKHFERLLQEVWATEQLPLQKVVHCWSLAAASTDKLTISALEQSQSLGCGSTLHLLQSLVKYSELSSPRLWLVTQGAVAVDSSLPGIAQASLWGLGKVVALEHSELFGGLIDLAPDAEPSTAALNLLTEISNAQAEGQLAFRSGQRYVARLVRSQQLATNTASLQPESTYLITGGLGALGLKVAQWMLNQGARHLVLTGRRAASEKVQTMLAQMEQAGAKIFVARADVANQQDMEQVFAQIQTSMPPLRGIIHAAGILDDGILLQQDWQRFAKVLSAKVHGSWNLHLLTQEMSLDFFVCFSSIASLLGSPGQGNYAAANAFMDALSHYRQSLGLPSLSINWGPWSDVGMAASLASHNRQRWDTQGVSLMTPEQGLQVLGVVLGQATSQIGVLPIQWSVFSQKLAPGKQVQFLSELVSEVKPKDEIQQASTQQGEFLQQLQAAPLSDRYSLLIGYIQNEVAHVLGLGRSQLPDLQQGLVEMGMDSLMAVELKKRLDHSLNCSLPVNLIFEHPTIQDLAQYLGTEVLGWNSLNELAELETLLGVTHTQTPTDLNENSEHEDITL